MKTLNYKNKEWMEFFHKNRNLWSPVATEWERLAGEFLGRRVKVIKRELYIERTKDFYIKDGLENTPHFIQSIKRRESLGDKLN
jgi:hypothetical protein